jgi:hypothetical protein
MGNDEGRFERTYSTPPEAVLWQLHTVARRKQPLLERKAHQFSQSRLIVMFRVQAPALLARSDLRT